MRATSSSAVPGPSAAVMALIVSGLAADRFVFEGFLPRKGNDRAARLAEIAAEHRTTVIYEAPHRVERTLDDLREACGDDRVVVVARELTKLYEEVVRGPFGTIDIGGPRGEYVLVLEGAPIDDAPHQRRRRPRSTPRRTRRQDRRPETPLRPSPRTSGGPSARSMRSRSDSATTRKRTPMSEYVNVASSGPSAAFFDLDRTLISGSSAFTLALQARKAGLIPNLEFARDAAGAISFQLFGADDDTTDAVKARVLKAVAGMRQSDLQALNVEVLPRLLAKLRPEARRLLDRHRHAGRDTFIVSAAPQEIVEPLAHSFGMTSGIGTRSHVVDGRYTGDLEGPFCYGPGKVEAMVELANWNGYELDLCYAYSDSASDLPMLEAVGHPVAVNPDAKLERHARRHGWPIVIFSQQTKSVVRRTAASIGTIGIAGVSFAAGVAVAGSRGSSRGRGGRRRR